MTSARHQDKSWTDKLRIAFTAPRYHTNQVNAVRALQDRGCEVGYFVLYEGPTEDHTLLEPVVLGDGLGFRMAQTYLRRRGRLLPEHERSFRHRWGYPPIARFWRELAHFDPDVVVVRRDGFPFFALPLVFARLQSARIVIYTLGPKYVLASRRKRFLGRLLTAVFHCEWITHVEGDSGLQEPWNSHVHYVPLPIAAASGCTTRVRDRHSPLQVLCIGKFEERKNLDLMVDVFRAVAAESSAHLTIVGECSSVGHERYLKSLQGQVDRLGVAELVTVLMNVPFRRMEEIYRQHDVFVLPSRDEPLGVVILEAMSYGLPVICSDTAGVQWCIEQGGNGYVFRSDDAEDLALALRRILQSPGGIERMGRRSLELVASRHSSERYYETLMAAITGATGPQRS